MANYDHITPEYIKEKLRQYNMTQEQLGLELGLEKDKGARQRVNNWIHGKRNMDITTKAAIAGVFYRIRNQKGFRSDPHSY